MKVFQVAGKQASASKAPPAVATERSKSAFRPGPHPAHEPPQIPPLARARLLQAKLRVNTPGDRHEREADAIADRVMRESAPSWGEGGTPGGDGRGPSAERGVTHAADVPSDLQRACAACDSEHEVQRVAAGPSDTLPEAEARVAAVQGGHPPTREERAFFEPRFGFDFSGVRIHTGPTADAAARSVGALAYTRGRDIVFREGSYAPGTDPGRRLLAHELAHVVQQGAAGPVAGPPPSLPVGGSVRRAVEEDAREPGDVAQQSASAGAGLSAVEPMIQRACPSTTCPVIAVPWPAYHPLSEQAEKCIQDLYGESHSGNLISYNKGWTSLTATGVGGPALKCIQQKWFTGPSGMYAGEPDIWDFTNNTMYEVTTPLGASFRIGKLGAEVKLATDLASTAECGGSSFDRGTWFPPGPCYSLGGDFYISVYNVNGVLIYNLVKESAKEAALAAMLAMLAAGVKSGMFQSMGKGLLGAAGKKLLPGYAIASAVAALVLISSGRAEAKIGGGGDEPLVGLFKALAAKGDPVPPEVQHMIESDPELKKLVEDAMSKDADPTDAQKKLSAKVLQLINDNKDQFSADDLKALLAVSESAGKSLPPGDVTVDTLKQLAQAKGVDVDATATATATATGTGKTDPSVVKDKDKASGGGDAKTDDPDSKGLSKKSVELIKNASAGQKLVFDGVFGSRQSGAKGPLVTDADVDRFFSLIPKDITTDKAKAILAKTEPYKGGSVNDLLNGLQTAAAGELSSVPTETSADPGVGGGAASKSGPQTPQSETLEALKKAASKGDFSKISEGGRRFQTFEYGPTDIVVGNTLTVTLLSVIGGKKCAAVTSFRVSEATGLDPSKLDTKQTFTIKGDYTYSSEFVDADGNIAAPRNFIVGKAVNFTTTYTPASKPTPKPKSN